MFQLLFSTLSEVSSAKNGNDSHGTRFDLQIVKVELSFEINESPSLRSWPSFFTNCLSPLWYHDDQFSGHYIGKFQSNSLRYSGSFCLKTSMLVKMDYLNPIFFTWTIRLLETRFLTQISSKRSKFFVSTVDFHLRIISLSANIKYCFSWIALMQFLFNILVT